MDLETKNIPTQRNEDYLGSYHTADDHIEEYPEEPEIYTKEQLDDALSSQLKEVLELFDKYKVPCDCLKGGFDGDERVVRKINKENKNLAKHRVNIQSGRLFVDGRELCGAGSHSVCYYCKTRCSDAMQMTMTGQLCACIHPDKFEAQSFDKI